MQSLLRLLLNRELASQVALTTYLDHDSECLEAVRSVRRAGDVRHGPHVVLDVGDFIELRQVEDNFHLGRVDDRTDVTLVSSHFQAPHYVDSELLGDVPVEVANTARRVEDEDDVSSAFALHCRQEVRSK